MKYIKWLLFLLLPVFVLIRFPVDGLDQDVWWQMAQGKYLLEHFALKMDLSVFSWTPTDPNWIYSAPFGSIAIYIFYNLMGGFGLWLLQWSIFAGVFTLFILFLRQNKIEISIPAITYIFAVFIACSLALRFYKPELFSGLFIPLIVYLFYYIKINNKPKMFYLYPLIFVLWVNFHGVFIVGLIILAVLLIGEVINWIFFEDHFNFKAITHLSAAYLLSLAAVLINPYGWDYISSIIVGQTVDNSFHNEHIMAYHSMWGHLKHLDASLFTVGLTVWPATIFFILIAALSLYNIHKNKSFDFAVALLAIVLYYQGMNLSRAGYYFPLASFFLFFYLVHKTKINLKNATIPAIMIFVFIAYGVSFTALRNYNQYFGIGIENYAPVEEVEFIKKINLPGPVFNDYVIGGYLTWKLYPKYKVFIDPRGGLYLNQVFPDYIEFSRSELTKERLDKFTKKYPFKIIILHYREMNLIYRILIAGQGDWRLLYFGKNAAVLMHKSLLPLVTDTIAKTELSHERFKDVKNPAALANVFAFYINLNPKAARYIYDRFQENVSDYYQAKQEILQQMDSRLMLIESKIQKHNMK